MSAAPLKTMEIEQQLAADENGELLANLVATMVQGRDRTRANMDAGVGAVDRRRLELAREAFDAGARLLPQLWQAQRR